MAGLNETPKGDRIHIAFFGLRNAGKSTLVNAFTRQDVAIVSDVAGTTTDPVSKAMEILPLGPCLVTDTAGLDDVGELGGKRVEKTLSVLATADIAVWVDGEAAPRSSTENLFRKRFDDECRRRGVAVLEYRRGESVDALRARIAALRIVDMPPGLLDGIASPKDRIVCVCPIDESAPKGRLILPQVQLIRECLDIGAWCAVCQPRELRDALRELRCSLVVTDSQAFGEVRRVLADMPPENRPALTSFSILFARQKGDLAEYLKGLAAIRSLKDGDRVLVAEGCTHHRQCNDIGTVKIPKALAKIAGRQLQFSFASGAAFGVSPGADAPALVVQCGGCMLTRREVLRRIGLCREACVPIVNYGMLLAAAHGLAGTRPDGLVEI